MKVNNNSLYLRSVNHSYNKLYDQQMASRWSKEGDAAQISAFYSGAEVQDVTYFGGIEQAIEKALQQAAITTENENARLWIDAISNASSSWAANR